MIHLYSLKNRELANVIGQMREDIETIQSKASQNMIQKTDSLSDIIKEKNNHIERLTQSIQNAAHQPSNEIQLGNTIKNIQLELREAFIERDYFQDECNALRTELREYQHDTKDQWSQSNPLMNE